MIGLVEAGFDGIRRRTSVLVLWLLWILVLAGAALQGERGSLHLAPTGGAIAVAAACTALRMLRGEGAATRLGFSLGLITVAS